MLNLILLAAAVISAQQESETQDKPLAPLERVLDQATEAGYVDRRRGLFPKIKMPGDRFRELIEDMTPEAQRVAYSFAKQSGMNRPEDEPKLLQMIEGMSYDLELRIYPGDTAIFRTRVKEELEKIAFNKRFGWPGLQPCDEDPAPFKQGSDWSGRSIHDNESPYRIDGKECPFSEKWRQCHERSCDPRGDHCRGYQLKDPLLPEGFVHCHRGSQWRQCKTDYDCNGAGPDGLYSFKYHAGRPVGIFGRTEKSPGSGMPSNGQWIRQACVNKKCKAVKGWTGPKGIGQSCSGDFYASSTRVPETRCARGSYCQPSHHICVSLTG